eukprot:TRINITY_DN4273_c0_g1_i3.p1 TRINITY_DN4273_c0_g1~~TRINITY_DN4273_c0_g1_i3.p1  ORF type:complete len:450 (-),score=143.62 TRINITY_DN4273_c0_g1_i3:46-1395(-)
MAEESDCECSECSVVIPPTQNRFHCDTCGDYDLCEACYFSERNKHVEKHSFTAIKGADKPVFLYTHVDRQTSRILYLTNSAAVTPRNLSGLRERNVRAVLSVMEIDEQHPLRSVYHGKPYCVRSGIVYHNIAMPDVTNPKNLPEGMAETLLPEATEFIDFALSQHGNCVVHCELGKRRSPTIFTAWLTTRRMTVDQAVGTINSGYVTGADWLDSFRKQRMNWIQFLRPWSVKWKAQREAWVTEHTAECSLWRTLFEQADRGEEDKFEDETATIEEQVNSKDTTNMSENIADNSLDWVSEAGSKEKEGDTGSKEKKEETKHEEETKEKEVDEPQDDAVASKSDVDVSESESESESASEEEEEGEGEDDLEELALRAHFKEERERKHKLHMKRENKKEETKEQIEDKNSVEDEQEAHSVEEKGTEDKQEKDKNNEEEEQAKVDRKETTQEQ